MHVYCQLQHALTSFGITVEQQPDAVVRSSTVQQTGHAEPMNVNLQVQSSKTDAGVSCFPSTVIMSGK